MDWIGSPWSLMLSVYSPAWPVTPPRLSRVKLSVGWPELSGERVALLRLTLCAPEPVSRVSEKSPSSTPSTGRLKVTGMLVTALLRGSGSTGPMVACGFETTVNVPSVRISGGGLSASTVVLVPLVWDELKRLSSVVPSGAPEATVNSRSRMAPVVPLLNWLEPNDVALTTPACPVLIVIGPR